MDQKRLKERLIKEQGALNIRDERQKVAHIGIDMKNAFWGLTLCGIELERTKHTFDVKKNGLKRCRTCTRIYLNRIGWNLR
jgi:hypothetical protein